MKDPAPEDVKVILCSPLDHSGLRAGRLLEEAKCLYAVFLVMVENIMM